MRNAQLLMVVLISFCILFPTTFSQSQTIDVTITPTQDRRIFPRELICSAVQHPNIGQTWNKITIGSTLFSDVKQRLVTEGYLVTISDDGEFSFDLKDKDKRALHTRIVGCITDDKVSVISIYLPTDQETLIADFVSQYGNPDVVTWSIATTNARLLFWFEKGISAEVITFPDYMNFSRVGRVIYFPYQTGIDYEKRWPFNKALSANYPVPNGIKLESKQNPFDFPSMIQTITAEPSRTLIPTPTSTKSP